jgi:glycerol-3-phosphate dehydrogenase (NAD(P)+)
MFDVSDQRLFLPSLPPSLREIIQELVTCVVVASDSEVLANEVHDLMSSHYFRVFTSGDVVGVEVRNGGGGREGGRGRYLI